MPQPFKRNPLSRDEVDRLLRACRTDAERLAVLLPLLTGLRLSEIVSLRPANYDQVAGHIRIISARHNRETREIPVSPTVKSLLSHFFSEHASVGMSARSIQRTVARVAKRARIDHPVSPHVLRHTFASRAVDAGIPLHVLQHVMGHASTIMTERYLRAELSRQNVICELERVWKEGGVGDEPSHQTRRRTSKAR